MNIKNVAVLGGSGNVGSLMGGIIAAFGKCNVYLVVRDKKKIDANKIICKIYKSIRANSIKEHLHIIDYEEAKTILGKCEWIFESVAEDYEAKSKVLKLADEYSNEDAIITTGTSGLSINKLSQNICSNKRKNFFGTHFFNPPYTMNLCEVILSNETKKELANEFIEYMEQELYRNVIMSSDEPAFIANRIGFKVLMDILAYSEKLESSKGIDYLDYIFSEYTGRAMAPMKTIDFVGLDIYEAIIANIYNNTNDLFKFKFVLPSFFEKLIADNCIGNKTNCGLYKKIDNDCLAYDVFNEKYITTQKYSNPEKDKIISLIRIGEYVQAYKLLVNSRDVELKMVVKVLINYIIYAFIIGKENAYNIQDCDIAMEAGFGWCPPFALKKLFDEAGDFKSLCEEFVDTEVLKKYNVLERLHEIPISKYDYRKYIRAI